MLLTYPLHFFKHILFHICKLRKKWLVDIISILCYNIAKDFSLILKGGYFVLIN